MKIYKYLNFEDALKTLKNNSVVLNNPIDYNDPFDCVITTTNEEKEKCHKKIINYFLFREFSNLLFQKNIPMTPKLKVVRWELKVFKTALRKNPFYDGMPIFDEIMNMVLKSKMQQDKKYKERLEIEKNIFLSRIDESIKKIKDNLLVSCFSNKNDSILMWSHYADKHKGICVEFEVESSNFYKVEYGKKRLKFDLNTICCIVLAYDYLGEDINPENPGIKKAVLKMLTQKFIDWQYESEFRTIHTKSEKNEDIYKPKDKYLLKMPSINKIFVGCKMAQKQKKQLTKDYPNIKIVEMIESETEYSVHPKE